MDLTNFYYSEIIGVYDTPTENEEGITRQTIAFLRESGLSEDEIFKILLNIGGKVCIRPSDLPDDVWKNSLVQRDTYYCHHALQLIPPDPIVKNDGNFLEYPFYREIKARFLEKDLADYFYSKFRDSIEILDPKKYSAQLMHLIKKYRFDGVEPLDIVLLLIDEADYQDIRILEPFDLGKTDLVATVVDRLKKTLAERHSRGLDRIVWRNYLIDDDGNIVWRTQR